MPKKNTMLIASLGILTLLVTVLGSTFAYFNIQTNANTERTIVDTTSAKPSGVVTFDTKTEFLTFQIADAEMSTDNVGKKYYATNDITANYATEEAEHVFTLAEAKVNGGDISFKCYYDFTISLAESSNMHPETKGEVVLNFGGDSTITSGHSIDLIDLIENKTMNLQGYFYPLRPVQYNEDGSIVGVKIVTMEMYIVNTSKEQAPYVANTRLSVHIEPTYISDEENMFKCEEIHE